MQRNFLMALVLCAASTAWADATLTHLSGQVTIQRANGGSVPGVVGAKVMTGDSVETGDKGFVRLELSDGAEMVLRPQSHWKLEKYNFDANKPADDSLAFKLLKGGLRTVSGAIGKRGNQDAYEGRVGTATIGIRGTQYDARICAGNCGALPDGAYFAVKSGQIQTQNPLGAMPVAAGQVAFVAEKAPPQLLPRDPGIGFTPPPAIPKLDEKKKVAEQQKAADAPKETPSADKPKDTATRPAGGSTGTGGSKSDAGGSKSDTNSGSSSSSGSGSGGSSASGSGANNSSSTSSAANSDAAVCVVE